MALFGWFWGFYFRCTVILKQITYVHVLFKTCTEMKDDVCILYHVNLLTFPVKMDPTTYLQLQNRHCRCQTKPKPQEDCSPAKCEKKESRNHTQHYFHPTASRLLKRKVTVAKVRKKKKRKLHPRICLSGWCVAVG